MARALILALALALAACGGPPEGWTVINGTPAQEAQAQGLVVATRVVTGGELPAGVISLVTGSYALDGTCNVAPPRHVTGCSYGSALDILIMPAIGLGPDLTATALPHELCHLGLNTLDQERANVCGLAVVIEYQKENP